jgi:hypothetical protein
MATIAFAIMSCEMAQAKIIAPQENTWAGIKTNDGVLFIWNVPGLSFTLELKGKNIKPFEDPNHIFFTVDGRVIQIQLAAINEFAPDAKAKKLDSRAILAAHRDWESKYIEDLLKSKVQLRTFNVRLSDGTVASMWQFDMPATLQSEAQKQLYLTVIKGDYVLMLNSEVTEILPEAEGRKFLLDTMTTFKISPTTIDIKKLSAELAKQSKP